MRQAKIVIHVVHSSLLPQALLALAERGDATPNRRHLLAQAEVEALDEGGLDVPAAGRQHLLHRLQGAKHDPLPHADQTAPAGRVDHLRIQQLGPRHPARLGGWSLVLAAWRLDPWAAMREERGGVRL